MPQNREQEGADNEHTGQDEGVPEESVKVVPDGKEGHVQCNISHSGIGLEDGNDCDLDKHEEHRVLLQLYRQGNGVEEHIDLKDAYEEKTKVFKHLCKEVPEKANIGCQIWNRKAEI